MAEDDVFKANQKLHNVLKQTIKKAVVLQILNRKKLLKEELFQAPITEQLNLKLHKWGWQDGSAVKAPSW